MSRKLIYLVCFLYLLCMGATAKIIEVAPADAGMPVRIIGAQGGGGVPDAGGGSLQFSDGWESNDYSGWDDSTPTSPFDTSATANTGSYGARHTINATDDSGFSEDIDGGNYTESYMDAWVRANDVTAVATGSQQIEVMRMYDDSFGAQYRIYWDTDTGDWDGIDYDYYDDSGSNYNAVAISPAINTWYCVRVYWKIASGAGQNDGIFKMWFDTTCGGGSAIVDLTNVDNDTKLGAGLLYPLAAATHGWDTANGTILYYDDFEFYSGAP